METKHLRKFKLVKEYPNSFEKGTIANKTKDRVYCCLNNYNTTVFLEPREIENQPEFWEEIVEKEYEILSFRHTWGSIFTKSCSKNKTKFTQVIEGTEHSEIKLLIDKDFTINSIKRLSDGEIFTVGDKITLKFSRYLSPSSIKTIVSIHICHQGTQGIQFKNDNGGTIYINSAIKAKQSLFTTEDGVNISEGDEFWIITNKVEFYNNLGKILIATNGVTKNPNYKYFSTKEKAEEHIIWNKPSLSLKEIAKINGNYVKKNKYMASDIWDELVKLVKTKI